MAAIIAAVMDENQSCKVAKLTVIMLTITVFNTLVMNAGLSLPNKVGSIAGRNASWQNAITVSCHISVI